MNSKLQFNHYTIFDIVTCNPFTERGKDALKRLCLSPEKIEPLFFPDDPDNPDDPNKLYVDVSFRKSISNMTKRELDERFHDFSANFKVLRNHDDTRQRMKTFEDRFFDRASKLLYISGAEGSGKSIYLHYLLDKREKKQGDTHNVTIFNHEKAKLDITYGGITYTPKPDKRSSPWVFSGQLLDELCRIMIKTLIDKDVSEKVFDKFKQIFVENDPYESLDDAYRAIMHKFYDDAVPVDTQAAKTHKPLIESLYKLIGEDVTSTIVRLLHMLVIFIHCKQLVNDDLSCFAILAFDNIEHFIQITGNGKTLINDEDIYTISKALSLAVDSIKEYFGTRNINFEQHFKFIVVLRNATRKLLYRTLHTADETDQNTIEISCWFDFTLMYNKKKEILLPRIRENYEPEIYEYYALHDRIAQDNESLTYGNSFVEIGLEMFNGCMRRFEATISAIAFAQHSTLNTAKFRAITKEDYDVFWGDATVCRYLFRRAYIEQIFYMASELKYWAGLCLDDADISNKSLLQRVLMYLARRTEKYYNISVGDYLSLHSLICGVFVPPSGDIENINLTYEKHFFPLAKVLYAMNQPLYEDTNWSPLCVLIFKVNTDLEQETDPLRIIATKLSELWDDIKGKELDPSDIKAANEVTGHVNPFSVRITKAGFSFLHFFSDYAFYLARYSRKTPTLNAQLLFNANQDKIKAVVKQVYQDAEGTINDLNAFDDGFFTGGLDEKQMTQDTYKGAYLYMRNGIYPESIQHRTIFNHYFFLSHYKRFLDKYGDRLFKGQKATSGETVVNVVKENMELYAKLFVKQQSEKRIPKDAYLLDAEGEEVDLSKILVTDSQKQDITESTSI